MIPLDIGTKADADRQTEATLAVPSAAFNRAALSRFPKGVSGNPKGKPKGVQNKVTIEAREAAGQIVDNPAYRMNLMDRAINGRLPPQVEVLLWHYAKGVPKQTLDINNRVDVSQMSTEDLRAELAGLLARL